MDASIVPIAQLEPEVIDPARTSIRGVVTLVWPYSSSKRSFSILLVEPDFRLRRYKGQVRITFRKSCAKALARAGIASGDALQIQLQGCKWTTEDATSVQTPGRSVGWEITFDRQLRLQVFRDGTDDKTIEVDGATESPELQPAQAGLAPSTPLLLGSASSPPSSIKSFDSWASPAFLKKRTFGDVTAPSSIDIFADDSPTHSEPPAKRRKFGQRWRVVGRSPSPEIQSNDQETSSPDEAEAEAVGENLSKAAGTVVPTVVQPSLPEIASDANHIVPTRPSDEESLGPWEAWIYEEPDSDTSSIADQELAIDGSLAEIETAPPKDAGESGRQAVDSHSDSSLDQTSDQSARIPSPVAGDMQLTASSRIFDERAVDLSPQGTVFDGEHSTDGQSTQASHVEHGPGMQPIIPGILADEPQNITTGQAGSHGSLHMATSDNTPNTARETYEPQNEIAINQIRSPGNTETSFPTGDGEYEVDSHEDAPHYAASKREGLDHQDDSRPLPPATDGFVFPDGEGEKSHLHARPAFEVAKREETDDKTYDGLLPNRIVESDSGEEDNDRDNFRARAEVFPDDEDEQMYSDEESEEKEMEESKQLEGDEREVLISQAAQLPEPMDVDEDQDPMMTDKLDLMDEYEPESAPNNVSPTRSGAADTADEVEVIDLISEDEGSEASQLESEEDTDARRGYNELEESIQQPDASTENESQSLAVRLQYEGDRQAGAQQDKSEDSFREPVMQSGRGTQVVAAEPSYKDERHASAQKLVQPQVTQDQGTVSFQQPIEQTQPQVVNIPSLQERDDAHQLQPSNMLPDPSLYAGSDLETSMPEAQRLTQSQDSATLFESIATATTVPFDEEQTQRIQQLTNARFRMPSQELEEVALIPESGDTEREDIIRGAGVVARQSESPVGTENGSRFLHPTLSNSAQNSRELPMIGSEMDETEEGQLVDARQATEVSAFRDGEFEQVQDIARSLLAPSAPAHGQPVVAEILARNITGQDEDDIASHELDAFATGDNASQLEIPPNRDFDDRNDADGITEENTQGDAEQLVSEALYDSSLNTAGYAAAKPRYSLPKQKLRRSSRRTKRTSPNTAFSETAETSTVTSEPKRSPRRSQKQVERVSMSELVPPNERLHSEEADPLHEISRPGPELVETLKHASGANHATSVTSEPDSRWLIPPVSASESTRDVRQAKGDNELDAGGDTESRVNLRRSTRISPSTRKAAQMKANHEMHQHEASIDTALAPSKVAIGKRKRMDSPPAVSNDDKIAEQDQVSQQLLKEAQMAREQMEVNSPLTKGAHTKNGYISPLSNLHPNPRQRVDTFGMIVSIAKPERAATGPRDWFMTLYVTDASIHDASQPLRSVQLFRPTKSALPGKAAANDVVLLHDFKCQSQNRKPMLISTESSGWAVFGADGKVKSSGPPIEFDEEEITFSQQLHSWWSGVSGDSKMSMRTSATAARDVAKRTMRRQSERVSTPQKTGQLIHELRDGTHYADTSLMSDGIEPPFHELRDGRVYEDLEE